MTKKYLMLIWAITAGIVWLIISSSGGNQQVDNSAQTKTSSLDKMVGKKAPDFNLKDQNGRTFKLSDYGGKKLVLFFNEGIMCYPACWNQVAALGNDQKIKDLGVVTASIVADQPSQWESAFSKMPELKSGLILFDTDKSVSKKYNMLSLPSSMHKGSLPGHTYLVIDQKGMVRFVLDDPKMSLNNELLITEVQKI